MYKAKTCSWLCLRKLTVPQGCNPAPTLQARCGHTRKPRTKGAKTKCHDQCVGMRQSSDEALTTPSDPKSGQAQILKGGGCSQECESNTANNCVMAILRKFSVRWATPYTSSGQLRRSDINSHLPCVGGGIKKCLECGTDAAVCAAQTAESNLVAALRITLRVLEVHVPHRLLHCLAFPAHLSVHPLVFP